MANIGLYNIPEIDITFENIPYFKTLSSQQSWMDKRLIRSVEGKITVDPTRTTVTLPFRYSEIEQWNIDYVCLLDQSGKRLYYFVVDYQFTTSRATTLVLALDPMQTYMFDITFNPSFVDRAHTDRWKQAKGGGRWIPACPVLDEGLQFGDLVMGYNDKWKYRDKYIIASTSPLGKNKFKKPKPTTRKEDEYYG